MKHPIQTTLGTVVLVTTVFLAPLQGQLVHRYSFGNAAGDATSATLADSVGGADGIVRGAGALFTGTGLDLPGGDSNTAAYGDLPNGLISSKTAVTIEGWLTISNPTTWARIFDFGSTEPGGGISGEVTGPGNTNGGGTAGLDYFFLSATVGGDFNQQRVEVRDEDPAGGGIETFNSNSVTTFGQPIHFAVTWEDTGVGTSKINYWRNGVQMTTNGAVTSNLANLNDVNMWLGRSNWLGDANIDATFDEFRIYDAALTGTQVAISKNAGPDTLVDFAGDFDGDQIPNAVEDLYVFLDPNNPNDAALDQDNDGLTNLEEYLGGTKLDDDDTDDDGLTDFEEVRTYGTLPIVADSDSDGLPDGVEIKSTLTDPLVADSDGDGLNDGPEIAAGEDPKSAEATDPGLVHRYAFNSAAGTAPGATVIPDLIGGKNGVIVGDGALLNGAELVLPGGDGAASLGAYVDFPNGMISSLNHLTFEAWYTVRGASAWSHFWNFGSTEGGELSAGGSGALVAQDSFFFSHARGGVITDLRVGSRNADVLAPGGGTNPATAPEENYDYSDPTALLEQEYHVAATWTSNGLGGGQIVVYRNGVLVGSRPTTFTPRDINDVNNWLGRSNWTGDQYFNGDINEFRIYDGVMNSAAAAASYAAGSEAAPGSGAPVITAINYNKGNNTVTLAFNSNPGIKYSILWSADLINFTGVVATDISSGGATTTFGPFPNPSPGAGRLFFRVSE